jgi:hypothetical protein
MANGFRMYRRGEGAMPNRIDEFTKQMVESSHRFFTSPVPVSFFPFAKSSLACPANS